MVASSDQSAYFFFSFYFYLEIAEYLILLQI